MKMTRNLIHVAGLAACMASPAGTAFGQNYRSAVFSGSQALNIAVPASAPYNQLGTIRVEFRIHAWTSGRILGLGSLYINASSGTLSATSYYDAGAPTVELGNLNPAVDYLVRVQRDIGTGMFSIECWTADGTPAYLQGASVGTNLGAVTSTATNNFAGTQILGYNGGGDWLSGELAWLRWYSTSVPYSSAPPGNLPGGDLLDLEFEGGITDSSPSHLAVTAIGTLSYDTTALAVEFANSAVSVRAGETVVGDASPSGGVSYFWQQVGGPDLCTISSRTAAAPTISNCVLFGEHDFLVTVTDGAGQTATGAFALGLVPTNAEGVVVIADATTNFIVGPQVQPGFSPWPWYELQIAQMSDYWYGNPGSSSGNSLCQIEFSGCTWLSLLNQGGDPSINYYDAVLVNYQQYYRTGLTKYQTRARALARFFWTNFWNNGAPAGGCDSNWAAPRDGTAAGLLMYERESGDTSMYSCLDAWIGYELNNYFTVQGAAAGKTSFSYGGREPGYAFYFATLEAQRDPNNVNYQWLSALGPAFRNVWVPFQCSATSTNPECASNTPPITAPAISVTSGSAGITGTGTQFTAIPAGARFWVYDPSQGWNYFYIASVASDQSLTLTRAYPYASQAAAEWSYDRPLSGPVPSGAYRWNDIAWPGYGEQGWHIGIAMEGIINYYKLTGDPNALGVMEAWVASNNANQLQTAPCAGVPGVNCNFEFYAQYCGWCPTGSTCTDSTSLSNSRAQNNTVPHVYGYLYRVTGNPSYLTIGDMLFGADFGATSGPDHDGYAGLAGSIANNGKEFGQTFRSSGHYMADRTGTTPSAIAQTLSAAFDLASVRNASSVRVTLVSPDGASTSAVCQTSPCLIIADGQQGNHRMTVQYLSAGGETLAQTQSTVMTVP